MRAELQVAAAITRRIGELDRDADLAGRHGAHAEVRVPSEMAAGLVANVVKRLAEAGEIQAVQPIHRANDLAKPRVDEGGLGRFLEPRRLAHAVFIVFGRGPALPEPLGATELAYASALLGGENALIHEGLLQVIVAFEAVVCGVHAGKRRCILT